MNMNELFLSLSNVGAELGISGDKLWIDCASDVLSEEQLNTLREHKEALRETVFAQIGENSVLPLSSRQRDMWTIWKLNPSSPAYNIAFSARLQPGIEPERLCEAFRQLVNNHNILRSRYAELCGVPFQTLDDSLSGEFTCISQSKFTQEQLIERIDAESDLPFDLSNGPLIRACVLEKQGALDEAVERFLTVVVHHIAADFVSLGLLTTELSDIYKQLGQDERRGHQTLPQQYDNYVRWESKLLREKQDELAAYWMQRIPTVPSTLSLPADRPRPSVSTGEGNCYTVLLDEQQWASFALLSKKYGVTPYIATLAIIETLLYRYSGQRDIAIGSPVSNRDLLSAEGVIGDFVNPVVFISDIRPGISFDALLIKVRDTVLGALENRIYPFSALINMLHPERVAGASPLFQASYIWHQGSFEGIGEDAGIYADVLEASRVRGAANDISFIIVQRNGKTQLRLTYSTDLFERSTIERMAGHFVTLIDGVLAAPHTSIMSLPMLSDAEIEQQLTGWNRTQTCYPAQGYIPQYFEFQVSHSPDAAAVVFDNQALTYRELNDKANQLASRLSFLGIGPDVLVGVCVERSFEMIIGLLAVLKSGGAYLPLEPSYPQERLDYMLDDAGPDVLLVAQADLPKFSTFRGQVVVIDAREAGPQFPVSDLPCRTQSHHLAYCIYTSGSTGKPKGVMNSHEGILNRLLWMQATYPIGSGDRVLQKTSFCFDVSVWELFWPLMTGATLVLADPKYYRDPGYLCRTVIIQAITVMHFVPAMLQEVTENGNDWSGNCLRHVFCSGEALKSSVQNKALALWPECALHNLYGPTEAAVDVSFWRCTPSDESTTIPIGRPIANTQMYILDGDMNLLPAGALGEIYIGGVGLARGYLKRPALTAERFVPDPFSVDDGARLYRSGDLGRQLPDGVIVYAGRIDHQVKVRGFRIELGEIEAELSSIDGVGEVVVQVHEDQDGDKKLVAYLTAERGIELTRVALRHELAKSLPDYMLPSFYVFLDIMPLTFNGKIDRKALRAPDDIHINRSEGYVAPRNEIESTLSLLWSETLKLDRVGVLDNFFELGGHSLLATQLVTRIREQFGVDLPLVELFNAPTISSLAGAIADNPVCQRQIPTIVPTSRDEPLRLSFAQERLWFLDQLEPENQAYNIPMTVLIKGVLNLAAIEAAFNALIERHEILKTNFVTVDGCPLQQIAKEKTFTLNIVNLQENREELRYQTALQLCKGEAVQPFSLNTDLLFRASLYSLSSEKNILSVTMHHIISDGWSIGVLIQEIGILYESFCHHQVPLLSSMPLQYADYAVWQREWLQKGEMQRQLDYWCKELAGIPTVLELPTQHTRPALQRYRGATITATIDKVLTRKLNYLGKSQDATLFMTLISVFSVLLNRYSGQDDICIGYPIANRTQLETRNIIGLFVNSLVLRSQPHLGQTFAELLMQTRDKTLAGYVHQDVPFEKLVEVLQPVRSLDRSPIFQVMFALQNIEQQIPHLSGLSLTPITLDIGVSKLDLNVTVTESHGELAVAVEYNTDLFEEEQVKSMMLHFNNLLISVVDDPYKRLSDLSLLERQEVIQQCVEWNNTQKSYSDAHQPAHVLFEQQARRVPDAAALELDDGTIVTYRELSERAGEIAVYLTSKGVEKGDIVGLCVTRSLELIAGMLGIFKAGAVLLPLDPTYPTERLAYMFEHAQSSILLTQRHLVGTLPVVPAMVVELDADWPKISQATGPLTVSNGLNPYDLAYVIYTSGSTGKPKGVMVTHEGLTNFLLSMQENIVASEKDIFLALTSFSFDISFLETLLPLSLGAKILQPSRETVMDFNKLAILLTRPDLTIVQATPATWRMLLEYDSWQNRVSPLTVLSGGEALPATLARRLIALGGKVYNLFGPTETTIWSAMHVFMHGNSLSISPIGRPIANTQIYIIDRDMNLLPTGAVGEIYIGGLGLARGYLHRPDLTAERFVPNPFSESGARLYRTGDLGRYLPDGNIAFVGRVDHQVKIRGFRIELGEVESVLRGEDGIDDVVVYAHGETDGDQQLVAYVVPKEGAVLDRAKLRAQLSLCLPEYMVPGAFIFMAHLPLTLNGKIDRKALPTPDRDRNMGEKVYIAPQNEIEIRLASIWSEVLKIDKVSIRDNFFELGGHSLLAARLLARIRTAFNTELPLVALFESPTISELAQLLANSAKAVAEMLPELIAEPEHISDPFDMTPVQQAYWVGRNEHVMMGNIATHVYSEITFKQLDIERLTVAWNKVIRRHSALRCVFLPTGKQQILTNPGEYQIDLEIFVSETFTQRQQHISGIRKRMSHQVFATETWPLFELKALDLGDECRLFISIDALIMDAWSYQVLLSDVNTYYQEPTLELPTLDVSFRDYVSWLVRYHQTHAYERAKMYWLERLNTLPAAPALPMKKRPNEISKPTFVRREFFLSREAWSALQKRGQKRKVTPTVILLMAYSQVLAQWSRDPHFTLNLTLFNRPPVHPDIDRLIGDFTSTTLLEITDSADTFENRATMLQKQLWMDLENRAFSGLDVLRAMVRSKADGQPILMPVVFTGAIGFEAQQGALGDTESLLSQLGGQVDYQISQTPQVWLDHTVNEAGGKLHVCWDAVEDVFPAGMLDAMFDIYTTLLNMLAGSDEAWLSPHVNRLPPTQRAVRDAFNHTYVPRQPTTLSQLFLDSVSRHRNAIALIGPTMTLSYGELFNRAAEIAAQLQQLEIKKNELVAVAMEKCEEQVIACLGIHLAGAAYVPIDAALPTDRQKSLFEQSGVRFAVTQMRWPTTLLRPEGVTFISGKDSMECIDSPLDMLGLQGVSSRDLAYVIFTSGSTGTPKGVSIDHRGACNTIMDLNRRFSITAADRVYALSSLSFDLSVFDIFGTLAAGGTVVVPDKRSSHNPGEWCHQIVDQGITIWNSVPALMGLLLDYAHEKSFDLSGHLRLVLLSGDWIPVTLVPLMQRYLPQAQLISLGGATEASIWSVYHSIRDLNQDWNSVPYGQPLENQQCFILNAHGDECPDWVTGELFIGGQGVAMGYWKDEVKTCASFIAYPQTGERIYRTGDLVRFRPDGGMEFIGRNDSQVKLNGNRIELGEIETVLAPALVKKCVACLEDGENDKELIAYVVLNSGIERQTHEGKLLMSRLRQHLLETLPVYMVPKTLFVVDNLPLTTNGKIDRKGLRLLRLSEERNRQSDNVRTQVINHEEITDGICRLVAETLNVEHVDPEENLLEKGMTSIDFIRIFNQLEGRYGVRPDFAMLYREPRVSSISRSISENQVPGNKAEVKKKILLSPEKRDEFKRSRNFLRKEFTTHKTHTLQYSSVFSETDHLAWMAQRKTAAQFVHKQLRGEVLTALMNRLAFIEHGEKLRTLYPSAGALYPVQTYLQVEKGMVAGLEAGLYYFQPVEKLLILISPERPIDQHHHYPVNQSAAASSAFTLFLIADLRAIEPIYGEVGRDMCLIEAGAMLQLLMWDCKSLGIDLRPIGGVVFESARQPLQLSSDHILLHTILGGASLVEPEQTTKKEYIELSI